MTERPGRVGTDATERLALTRPQAEAFVTLNAEVAHDVEEPVTTAPFDALRWGASAQRPGPPRRPPCGLRTALSGRRQTDGGSVRAGLTARIDE
jgi:hypothetical protein